jgi:hypothetical protein
MRFRLDRLEQNWSTALTLFETWHSIVTARRPSSGLRSIAASASHERL